MVSPCCPTSTTQTRSRPRSRLVSRIDFHDGESPGRPDREGRPTGSSTPDATSIFGISGLHGHHLHARGPCPRAQVRLGCKHPSRRRPASIGKVSAREPRGVSRRTPAMRCTCCCATRTEYCYTVRRSLDAGSGASKISPDRSGRSGDCRRSPRHRTTEPIRRTITRPQNWITGYWITSLGLIAFGFVGMFSIGTALLPRRARHAAPRPRASAPDDLLASASGRRRLQRGLLGGRPALLHCDRGRRGSVDDNLLQRARDHVLGLRYLQPVARPREHGGTRAGRSHIRGSACCDHPEEALRARRVRAVGGLRRLQSVYGRHPGRAGDERAPSAGWAPSTVLAGASATPSDGMPRRCRTSRCARGRGRRWEAISRAGPGRSR